MSNNYKINEQIIEQKDIRFSDFNNMLDGVLELSTKDELAADDTYMLLFYGDQITELNLMGSVIWEELKNNLSINEIKEKLLIFLDIAEDILVNDIQSFIDELVENKLVYVS